jgi:hypothetical protein
MWQLLSLESSVLASYGILAGLFGIAASECFGVDKEADDGINPVQPISSYRTVGTHVRHTWFSH